MSIWRWADRMDFVPEAARVTLGEGNTPLVRSRRIGPNAGLHHLYFKLEFTNPTASYKYSPKCMSGVKSLSYELAEQLETGIGHVFCPAGGGGMCVAVARGFQDLIDTGVLGLSPRVECVQPAGNDTIASPLRSGAAE